MSNSDIENMRTKIASRGRGATAKLQGLATAVTDGSAQEALEKRARQVRDIAVPYGKYIAETAADTAAAAAESKAYKKTAKAVTLAGGVASEMGHTVADPIAGAANHVGEKADSLLDSLATKLARAEIAVDVIPGSDGVFDVEIIEESIDPGEISGLFESVDAVVYAQQGQYDEDILRQKIKAALTDYIDREMPNVEKEGKSKRVTALRYVWIRLAIFFVAALISVNTDGMVGIGTGLLAAAVLMYGIFVKKDIHALFFGLPSVLFKGLGGGKLVDKVSQGAEWGKKKLRVGKINITVKDISYVD